MGANNFHHDYRHTQRLDCRSLLVQSKISPPMQKTPISPETRLLIAAQILAGMQAPGYVADTVQSMQELRESAIVQTDLLIESCNCETIHPENHMWRAASPKNSSEGMITLTTFPQEPVNDASGH